MLRQFQVSLASRVPLISTSVNPTTAAQLTDDPLGTLGTGAQGINDAGQIVGYYLTGNSISPRRHGFLYSAGNYITIDDPLGIGVTRAMGLNTSGQIVGLYEHGISQYHGFLLTITPNPPPPIGTTADMILRRGDGTYETYDIGNNAILAGYELGMVGTDWAFVTLGGLFGSDTTDRSYATPIPAASKSTTSATITSRTPLFSAPSAWIGRPWASETSVASAKPTCCCAT